MGVLKKNDKYWMEFALKEAEKAFENGEIPVGAIVVYKNSIVGRGYNLRETLKDPTAHAEILAITSASETLESWRLDDCTMYVTLEPCPMCAGAILNARISRLVFGAYDAAAGMCGSVDNLFDKNLLNHSTFVKGGVCKEQCKALIDSFFSELRKKRGKE